MSKGYSVIILRDNGKEVRRFNERTFSGAQAIFSHQLNNLMWSRQHKLNAGLDPKEHGKLWLFDHDAGFELEERGF